MQVYTMAKEVSFQDRTPDYGPTRWKERDLAQTRFFRVACRTFGPPKSRTRRIVAPPMEKLESERETMKGTTGVASMTLRKSQCAGTKGTEEPSPAGRSVSDWILERKNLRTQLDNMGDVEKWLQGKPELTELERRVQKMLVEKQVGGRESREDTEDMDEEISTSKSRQHSRITPNIQQPSPDALAIMDYYLHQRRLRLVDLYNQTNKSKKKEISSHDLKSVRKEAMIPISDLQFDDLVISLGMKHPNHINYKELSVGRHLWWKNTRAERKKDGLMNHDIVKCFLPSGDAQPEASASVTLDSSLFSKWRSCPVQSAPSDSSKSHFLQVPPISLEEMRPLSYEDMEEIGKNYRERRRRAQSNTRLLEWLEQCRLVRSGNAAIDAHALPSTLGEEAADLVEQFRRQGLQQYYQILKLCQVHGVPLTETLLEQALLHPGDKLICESNEHLQLRQPGTALRSKDMIRRVNNGAISPEVARTDQKMKNASESWRIFTSKSANKDAEASRITFREAPYPPEDYVKWVKRRVRGKKTGRTETLKCWTTFEQFEEMSRALKHRFPHSFYTSDDNAFWPGQLLEKLRIYLPKVSKG
ncbi:EF-hand calcium-binding domain-containing protein 12 isoform 2-T2 [Anomaloglossus baeobatrachus]|uniref:EF-hand calcium-binding domain-containing protein 12 n=1 Tax=Anomaloglossus baeobatrachus TaxID=238106 RepID=UPI003F4FC215